MTGKLYGIGVSVGDPELMTLKAARIIGECDVIAIPKEDRETCVAWRAAAKIVKEIEHKQTLYIPFPMTKDREELKKAHEAGAEMIEEELKKGRNVAFLTIGDPCVYATYMYVHKLVGAAGFETEIVNGITSFCAVSAAMNMPLCEENQELHIIPSSYGIEKALEYPGVKVLMKSASKLPQVVSAIEKRAEITSIEVCMIENCGMDDERIYENLEAIKAKDMKEISYYTTVIVKEKKDD